MTAPIKDDVIIEALRKARGMVVLAARSLSIEPTTIYRRLEKSERVKQALQEEREYNLDVAEAALIRAFTVGELGAIKFYLQMIGKHRGYVERTEHELTGKDGAPIAVRTVTAIIPVDVDDTDPERET